jgi:hypothetical protein
VLAFVKQGLRIQGDGQHMSVQIIGLDYDFWYEERQARGALPPGAEPLPLGPDGLLYYVCFREPGDRIVESPRVDTEAFATVEEATDEAESLVVGRAHPRVIWDG